MITVKNTYWNHEGRHQAAVVQLNKLIPVEGSVPSAQGKNKALEKFRIASNCYYDLYNNGLCNRARSFARIFGFAANNYRNTDGKLSDVVYEKAEYAIDKIIEAAAKEQGIEI